MNIISAANIPIYFDSQAGGYRLSRQHRFTIDNIALDELMIIAVALKRLAPRLNRFYQQRVEYLLRSLFSSQKEAIEDIISTKDNEALEEPDDLSRYLTSLILQVGVVFGKAITLNIEGEEAPGDIVIDKPSLSFDRSWFLTAREGHPEPAVPVEKIVSAQVRD